MLKDKIIRRLALFIYFNIAIKLPVSYAFGGSMGSDCVHGLQANSQNISEAMSI